MEINLIESSHKILFLDFSISPRSLLNSLIKRLDIIGGQHYTEFSYYGYDKYHYHNQ